MTTLFGSGSPYQRLDMTPWGRSDRPLFGAMPSAGTYAQSDAKLTPVRDGRCG